MREQSPITFVYFKLFDNCNLKCNMCDCWQLPTFWTDAAHYRRLLGSILEQPPAWIRFTGGEPLMHPQLPELVSYVTARGVRASMVTNALLLGRRLDEMLAAGLTEVVISLDGRDSVHEQIRGRPNSFRRIGDGLRRLAATDVSWGVNTVVQAANISHLRALVELFEEMSRPPHWWHLIPVRGATELLATPDQQAGYGKELPELLSRCRRLGITVVHGPPRHGRDRCVVPQTFAYVDGESGRVYGCNMLAYRDEPIGDLSRTPWPQLITSPTAGRLRGECATARHDACDACDPASRAMNLLLEARNRANMETTL